MAKEIDKKKISQEEIERRAILEKAEQVKEEQLKLDINDGVETENEYKTLLDQQIDDPVQKFQLYYKILNKLLRSNLPKGKENEPTRRIIYDEKNILINRGNKKDEKGIRGSDGRMAYMEDIELAISIVMDWVNSKGSYHELYMAFWNKNEELNYGHQD